MKLTKHIFSFASTIFTFCFLIFFVTSGLATDGEKNLLINVKNVKKAQGSILVAIYTDPKDYMKSPAYSQIAPVNENGEVIIRTAIPFGSYSITLFHDVNDNRNLDTNILGIPKEPYGFSNDARAPFGPPSYDASAVTFDKDGEKIIITLR